MFTFRCAVTAACLVSASSAASKRGATSARTDVGAMMRSPQAQRCLQQPVALQRVRLATIFRNAHQPCRAQSHVLVVASHFHAFAVRSLLHYIMGAQLPAGECSLLQALAAYAHSIAEASQVGDRSWDAV